MKKVILFLLSTVLIVGSGCEKQKLGPLGVKKGAPLDIPTRPGGDPDDPNGKTAPF